MVLPTFVGITVNNVASGWGETDNTGPSGAPQFLHLFLTTDNIPINAVHELGHSHGLRHTEEGGGAGRLYPGLSPYKYHLPSNPSVTRVGIGSPGWDPFTPKGGFNSGDVLNPVPGREFYNPFDEVVLDLMQYRAVGPLPPPDSRSRFWISDYQFTDFWLYNQKTNRPNSQTP